MLLKSSIWYSISFASLIINFKRFFFSSFFFFSRVFDLSTSHNLIYRIQPNFVTDKKKIYFTLWTSWKPWPLNEKFVIVQRINLSEFLTFFFFFFSITFTCFFFFMNFQTISNTIKLMFIFFSWIYSFFYSLNFIFTKF